MLLWTLYLYVIINPNKKYNLQNRCSIRARHFCCVRSEVGCPQSPQGEEREKQAVLLLLLVCCLHITATDSSAVGRERERERERERMGRGRWNRGGQMA